MMSSSRGIQRCQAIDVTVHRGMQHWAYSRAPSLPDQHGLRASIAIALISTTKALAVLWDISYHIKTACGMLTRMTIVQRRGAHCSPT